MLPPKLNRKYNHVLKSIKKPPNKVIVAKPGLVIVKTGEFDCHDDLFSNVDNLNLSHYCLVNLDEFFAWKRGNGVQAKI